MKQCLAKTKLGNRCKRPAAEDCGGYCRQHFDELPPDAASSAASRAKAKNMLKAIGTGVGIAEVLKEIWDIVGPFLSFREQHYFEIIMNARTTEESLRAIHKLTSSLARSKTTEAIRSRSRKT